MGLTKNNKKSTASIFKAGETYFNPSLKIHKMNVDDIIPGCGPPSRLITCLQDGVMRRNDIFVANKWLKPLQNDFCKDIVQDSMEILQWLNDVNENNGTDEKKDFKPFTFDFTSLYDSLTPELVREAVKHAIHECKPLWDDKFVHWLLSLIDLSMEAGFGKFDNKWYRPKTGIPTGGNISVQIANIAVFYAIKFSLYSNEDMMKDIVSTKRFIDDGTGIFSGSMEEFNSWKEEFTDKLKKFKLYIKDGDWDVAFNAGEMVHILDIYFGFDHDGALITDLYRKETDSRGYLHFNSCHPNHVFSSIVYSQALRLKRIVSNTSMLDKHLNEMENDFLSAKYPKQMVRNIINKVKSSPRTLAKNKHTQFDDTIILSSTFGRDSSLKEIVHETCKPFNKAFKCVSKTGPTIKSMLCNVKCISMGNRYGHSKPCGHKLCKACGLISGKSEINSKEGQKFRTAEGTCNTHNCVYAASCRICNKIYTGKTTQKNNRRINGHRDFLKKYVTNPESLNSNSDLNEQDKYSLAVHLDQEHDIRTFTGLDDNYEFTILEKCSPRSLDLKEHLWIQKLASLTPFGLNSYSPLGFSLIPR